MLVGFDYADDAGVYRLTPDTALVQTVDFFTPIVDDPYTFGQIAATNSLSDVYAMGGRPLTSLALVCFPEKGDIEILERILAGGLSKMMEAGCTVIGGHSIRDEETKFGYSVTGVIHPDKILFNNGAKPGDRLIGLNGKTNLSMEDAIDFIHKNPDREITLLVDRQVVEKFYPGTLVDRGVGREPADRPYGRVRERTVFSIRESVSSIAVTVRAWRYDLRPGPGRAWPTHHAPSTARAAAKRRDGD